MKHNLRMRQVLQTKRSVALVPEQMDAWWLDGLLLHSSSAC